TWVVVERFFLNSLPPELLGTWEVKEGPMHGGTFAFSRNGTLEIHADNRGTAYTLKARVAVEGKTLLTTTDNPQLRQEETGKSIIRELTANSLILDLVTVQKGGGLRRMVHETQILSQRLDG